MPPFVSCRLTELMGFASRPALQRTGSSEQSHEERWSPAVLETDRELPQYRHHRLSAGSRSWVHRLGWASKMANAARHPRHSRTPAARNNSTGAFHTAKEYRVLTRITGESQARRRWRLVSAPECSNSDQESGQTTTIAFIPTVQSTVDADVTRLGEPEHSLSTGAGSAQLCQ